jgi:molybdopterin-containing oxidoreductase family iron-sulfur binding subunit
VVCPVNATIHTEEGLNAMAYNRCIGTRYCANNCPYKARRFNYFDYNKRNPLVTADTPLGKIDNLYMGPLGERGDTELSKLQKNPNVSVRMRGVMEKCTYCVQRLEEAKIRQKQKARGTGDLRLPPDAVKVACQQACPAGAIEFGDLAQPESRINKMKANPRNYELLKYVGTAPRTTYLARIKNPNPEMPGYEKIGILTHKMH